MTSMPEDRADTRRDKHPVETGGARRRRKRSDVVHATEPAKVREIGGPKGPEPTRYGDWERNGRCIDF
ncbi:MAG: DUF1674 domain-containing protein [Alphaproteobacteria bacterium]